MAWGTTRGNARGHEKQGETPKDDQLGGSQQPIFEHAFSARSRMLVWQIKMCIIMTCDVALLHKLALIAIVTG